MCGGIHTPQKRQKQKQSAGMHKRKEQKDCVGPEGSKPAPEPAPTQDQSRVKPPTPKYFYCILCIKKKKKWAFLIIPHHSHSYVNTPSKTFISESVSSCLDLKQINFSFLAVGMSWVIITGNRTLCCQGPTWELGEVALATSVLTFKSILRVT